MNTELRLTLRTAALAYLRRGWSVFPLAVKGKTPLNNFQVKTFQRERKATPHEIIHWWRFVSFNIAIATGAISGLIVWDCDTEQAFTQTLKREFPDTPIARTGKGYHIYFQYPDFPVGNRAAILPGVDVRGDGGYVVAPPSVHPFGACYQWLNEKAPVAPAPTWILDILKATKHTTTVPQNKPEIGNTTAYGLAALRYEAYDVAMTTVNRNERLYRAALKMGSLIASGAIDQPTVILGLLAAASTLSADDGEAQSLRTIHSGINRGLESPRENIKRA